MLAGTVGTAIEWYDFFLYSTITGLVFARLYFPKADPFVGTLEAFGVYAVGFVARPIGAAIFGHYGDRLGRKAALIATLLLMGIATFLVALVPGYDRIGIWGAVLLTVLRFIQGIGVGGEWGGSVLLSMEWAQSNQHRGFIASWPQFGVPAGLFLANLAVLGVSAISGDQFITWGWRIPFLFSIVLIAIGLYIRLGDSGNSGVPQVGRRAQDRERAGARSDSPQPARNRPDRAVPHGGTGAVLSVHRVRVRLRHRSAAPEARLLIGGGALGGRDVSFVSIPLFGHLSDRFGRKRVYMLGAALTGLYGFAYFGLLDTKTPALVIAGDCFLAGSARHDVRSTGRADRGVISRAPAL